MGTPSDAGTRSATPAADTARATRPGGYEQADGTSADQRVATAEARLAEERIADIAATADLPYLCLLFVARVFIDTNVLFPFSVMDLMVALTKDGIHDVMGSDELLGEWERVIVRERHRSRPPQRLPLRSGNSLRTPAFASRATEG